MRFGFFVTVVIPFAASDVSRVVNAHLEPLSLVELGLEDRAPDIAAIRKDAKKKFLALMQDAEVKASHDPAVRKADDRLKSTEARFKVDSRKASDLLRSIKQRLEQSKKSVAQQKKTAAFDAQLIREFTEKENAKLEATERKFMELQQKRISSSFAEVPAPVHSSLTELAAKADGVKAEQQIHAAEKALSELSDRIKKRVASLSSMLNTPGHQFPGEVVL